MIVWLAGWALGAPVHVLAASSLTEVLPAMAEAHQRAGGGPVTFTFDGSSRLARQIEAGAPADLFFSADQAWMDWLADRAAIDPSTRVDLVRNALVVVVPASGQAPHPTSIAALASVARIGIASEHVPAGRYAREALATTWTSLEPRIIGADDVRTALAWVARGEVDAGVVYATDARVEPRVTVAFSLDPATHTPIVLPAARLVRAPESDAALAFLQYCRSPAGQEIFGRFGFLSVGP